MVGLRQRFCVLAALFVVLGTLGACTEVRFLIAGAKKVSDSGDDGVYKVGNPYQINSQWYYPQVDYDYDETGIASWYGPQFHGKDTANGEVFDMNAVSAAHKTLPLPTIARVTNLENGRSLVVRINDRGPFVGNRIIDLSRRAAQLLDFENRGTARVRVQVLADESRAAASALQGGNLAADAAPIKAEAMPKGTVSSDTLLPPPGSAKPGSSPSAGTSYANRDLGSWAPAASSPPPAQRFVYTPPSEQIETVAVPLNSRIWVQAGSFTQFDNANRARAQLSGLGPVEIKQVLVNGRDYYRVRVGPVGDEGAADTLLDQIIGHGYSGSAIVVD
ncbi:MAG: septal ring lytic transglycosylase RlpA family protein [Rhodospirillales bacterium]